MENKITSVDLFTGFLGSGKTTFIQKYGKYLSSRGIRFTVIENEYGKAGVDTYLLQDKGIETEELSGGCLCCTLKVDFHKRILDLHKKGIERIIVEPSGIYDVSQFFYIMTSPSMEGKCQIGNIITVVDPTQTAIYDEAATAFLKNQLLLSGGIILSRTQLLNPEVTQKAIIKLNSIAPETPILYEEDWSLLTDNDFETIMNAHEIGCETKIDDTDHSKLFQSCTLGFSKEYSSKHLHQILSEIISGNHGNIMRIKGFIHTEDGNVSVNVVPGQIYIEPTKMQLPSMLNIIGYNLDRKKLKDLFSQKI